MPADPHSPTPEIIAPMVHWIRHEKVMLDSDLAGLYGVLTKVLNQAVKRNAERFPADFMFQLTAGEWDGLKCQTGISMPAIPAKANAKPSKDEISGAAMRSQIVTASRRNVGALPYAFTEQGVAMLSTVLRSPRAVEVNIAIMRTFVQLRSLTDTHRDLARKLEEIEDKYDGRFRIVFDAIRQLMAPAAKPIREMGFHTLPSPKPAKKATRRKP